MIYLDHAATTPVLPEALTAAWPYLTTEFANPSSTYDAGKHAHDALEDARSRVAAALGSRAAEVVFTSGGTEGNNLAVLGLALADPRGRHIVSAQTEHESVLESIAFLERVHDFETTWLPVSPDGCVTVESLDAALRDDTTLITLMLVNNEIGTVHPIAEMARRAKARGARVHTDAVQAMTHRAVNVRDLDVDALTLSGHKVGAPKGSGAVYLRSGVGVEPLLHGGGQEAERRSGTENVAWAVALATALEARDFDAAREDALAHRTAEFAERVLSDIPQARLTGPPMGVNRTNSIVSFLFPGLGGEAILLDMERHGFIASSGAACAAGRDEPSHVITACGFSEDDARTSVRFSMSADTSEGDLMLAALALREAVASVAG